MSQSLTQKSWKEAATGGLILGLILVAVQLLEYAMRNGESIRWMPGLLNFAAIVAVIYFYGRKMADAYGHLGFTYGQSIGFVMKMMLFAGVIQGLGQYVLWTFVDPDFYIGRMETVLVSSGLSDEMVDMALDSVALMRNPFTMIFSGIFSMIIYGGIVGLFVSIFIKRPMDPFGDLPDGEERSNPETLR